MVDRLMTRRKLQRMRPSGCIWTTAACLQTRLSHLSCQPQAHAACSARMLVVALSSVATNSMFVKEKSMDAHDHQSVAQPSVKAKSMGTPTWTPAVLPLSRSCNIH